MMTRIRSLAWLLLALWALVFAWGADAPAAEEGPATGSGAADGGDLPAFQFSLSAQAPPGGGAAGTAYAVSLKETILLALKNNLDVTIEGFNPRIREMDITTARAAFDPVFTADASASRTRTRNNTAAFIPGSQLTSDSRSFTFNFKLTDKLPTGATTELKWTNLRSRTNSVSTAINPAYTTGLTATVTQPLLKNFGIDINRTSIRLATNNRDIARNTLKAKIFDVVTNAQFAYFDLVSALETQEVQRRSLALARELVDLNKARVRAGVAAPVEVIQAEAQAAAREQDVLTAEKAVRDAEDNLRIILNLPAGALGWEGTLVPAERPAFEVVATDLAGSVRTALIKRVELDAAKLDVANRELSVRLARNQLLPDLAIVGSAGLAGLDGSRRTRGGWVTEGGEGSSLGEMTSGRFNNWSAGLALTVPLGNRAAEAGYTQTTLQEQQSRASLRNLELQITAQVREAVRRIETNAKRVESARVARGLAEEQLRIEQQRLRAGVTTTFNVLQFQRDLTAAQAVEVQAVNDYQKSLANLEKVRGTVLEKFQIEL